MIFNIKNLALVVRNDESSSLLFKKEMLQHSHPGSRASSFLARSH
jgi:hypothetical protein